MKRVAVLIAFCAMTTSALAQKPCEYGGQAYSQGATICECPGLTGEGGYVSGGEARLRSRRLVCTATEGWKPAESMCLDVHYPRSSASARDDMKKFTNHYCPRVPINFAEMQRAIEQETSKFIDKAPKGTLTSMLEAICRRVQLEAQCKALLDAMGN